MKNGDKILVFGGTTEGKKVAEAFEANGIRYIYSTKTEVSFIGKEFGSHTYGPLDIPEMIAFCTANKIRAIVNASHPFATELHRTVHEAAFILSIPVIRFERKFSERVQNELVHYVSSYIEALHVLSDLKTDRLLALTGVQSIEKLKPFWEEKYAVFRILDRESSSDIAKKAGFPEENLILGLPANNQQQELKVIAEYGINAVLTKESGESGFLPVKIGAALQANIPIVIIERPQLPDSFYLVYNEKELLDQINQFE